VRSHPNLWPRVTSFENLYEAFRQARKGKRSRPDVAAFEFDLGRHLFELQSELLSGEYRPGGYRHFVVREPRHPYVFKADVSKFFPSVDHEILGALVARRIRCAPTRRLVGLILDSGAGVLADEYRMTWFPGDTLLSPLDRPRGLPIGNLTSQFWANVYLHELDRFVVRDLGWTAYVRYVDDFLLFADDKAAVHEARRRIESFLPALRLALHPKKTRVLPVRTGVPFLGFVLTPARVRLRRDGVRRFARRMRRYRRAFAAGALPLPRLTASVQSWIAHAAYGKTYRLRSALLADLAFARA
jgi:hypothetical protein